MKNNIKINSLLVDGGMTANKTFCQLLSNTLQKNISKPENIESTALGACIVSQIAEGLSIEDVKQDLKIYINLIKVLKIFIIATIRPGKSI